MPIRYILSFYSYQFSRVLCPMLCHAMVTTLYAQFTRNLIAIFCAILNSITFHKVSPHPSTYCDPTTCPLFLFTMSYSPQHGSFTYQDSFTISGSIKAHPKIWLVCSCLWVLSCLLIWKLELIALERASKPRTSTIATQQKISEDNAKKRTENQRDSWVDAGLHNCVIAEDFGGMDAG